MTDDRAALLARGWDEAADGYERYFVPRFAPWVADAVAGLPGTLPDGPVLVPCCGTFPELPALAAAHPDRELVGVDLSQGMIDRARRRADGMPRVRLIRGDATALESRWPGTAAGVVSVFGLQQLPDPVASITDWTAALRPGGHLSVVYWPPSTEAEGPFALARTVVGEALDDDAEDDDPAWPDRLAGAVTEAGGVVGRDGELAHTIVHPDARAYWTAVTAAGPMRTLVLSRGQDFVDRLRAEYLRRAPEGPWSHRPGARLLTAHRPA
ncbi:class I SAM-dependent methyltransferase [Phytomonospora sp. NPDC050363]|uniref:class I SAM-dependent methyltransferase n=1 Tax=Phytomonospora sp. NPDC050363 TaxID=3155642 RepID=UPI0033F5FE92